jgi:hypothetical protein
MALTPNRRPEGTRPIAMGEGLATPHVVAKALTRIPYKSRGGRRRSSCAYATKSPPAVSRWIARQDSRASSNRWRASFVIDGLAKVEAADHVLGEDVDGAIEEGFQGVGEVEEAGGVVRGASVGLPPAALTADSR